MEEASHCFVIIFSVFYFLSALLADNNSSLRLGHKYILGLTARAKMSLSRAQNIFYAQEHKLFILIVHINIF